MARFWISIWLANMVPHGRQARDARAAAPAGQAGAGPRLRRFGPVLLGVLVVAALAIVTLAFVFIWRRIGAKP
jgi:hypothetical protein